MSQSIRSYKLLKAEKLPNGNVRHEALMPGNLTENFVYSSIRIGMVWPSTDNPGYFVVGGMEQEDRLAPSIFGVVRILREDETDGISLTDLFDRVTDSYVGAVCNAVYVDRSPCFQEFYVDFVSYIDKRNLRGMNVFDVSHDLVFRWSKIGDFNAAGCLIVEKSMPLFSDIQGISREHLRDPNVEQRYFRLNGLSYLISGFSRNPPRKPLDMASIERGGKAGWLA